MLARLSALIIWGLVAATAVFWGLRLLVRSPSAPSYAVAVGDATAVRGDLTRLLGSAPVAQTAAALAPPASSRFKLYGIVAPQNRVSTDSGVALIAVDGKLPRAFTVGARIDGDLMLQSVSLRSASIAAAPGAPPITLELPPPTPPATGTLPLGSAGGLPATPPAIVPQYQPQPGIAPPAPFPAQQLPSLPQPASTD